MPSLLILGAAVDLARKTWQLWGLRAADLRT